MGVIMKNSVEYGTTTTINDVTVNGASVVTSGVAEVDLSANNTTFDNTGTGMTATDVQDAITELNSGLTNISTATYVTDFNNCKTFGFYRSNTQTSNTPTVSYYAMLVIPYSSTDLAQLAISVNYAEIYVRTFHDGTTWTAWKRCDNV